MRPVLKRTFCHLPGVGATTERRLWDKGILTWDDFLAADPKDTGRRTALAREALSRCGACLESGDAEHFAQGLPSAESWRLFPAFSERVAYLDIETTGLGRGLDHITTIALYDGQTVKTYVHGRNLEEFQEDIREYKLLVTFNGRCFDAPFIEQEMAIRLPKAHIDLRFVLKSLGLKGGLKAIEKSMGIARHDLDGVDGYFAVILWREFEATGDERVLETLLAYNVADVLSLEWLLAHAFNEKVRETPFAHELSVTVPPLADNPLTPHLDVVERLKARYGLF